MQVYSADGLNLSRNMAKTSHSCQRFDQIPPEMINNAFIATEDSRFYEHHGIDPVGIFRAASVALFSGHASQEQVLLPSNWRETSSRSPERTPMRKTGV